MIIVVLKGKEQESAEILFDKAGLEFFLPLRVFRKKASRRCCVLCMGMALQARDQQQNYRLDFPKFVCWPFCQAQASTQDTTKAV